jgi:hypothetical protein
MKKETLTQHEVTILYATALDLEALFAELKSDNSMNTMMALLGYPAPKNARAFARELRKQAKEQIEATLQTNKLLDKKEETDYNKNDAITQSCGLAEGNSLEINNLP